MSEPNESAPAIDCPPPAERAATQPIDPRGELLRMAAELSRTRDARRMTEYLRLRRLSAAARD